MHPLVREEEAAFLAAHAAARAPLVGARHPAPASRPAARGAATRSSSSPLPPRCSARACWRGPGMTAEQLAAMLAQADARTPKSGDGRISLWTPAAASPRREAQVRDYPVVRSRGGRAAACRRRGAEARPGELREIVLDTETTGTGSGDGDRIVEIGGVELLNRIPTGRSFHRYLNPERAMSPGRLRRARPDAIAFLADKPLFAAIAEEFLDFIGDAPAGDPQRRPSTSASSTRSSPAPGTPILLERARRRHPGAGAPQASRRARTASMRCAPATASTIRGAPSTARCSTPRSWPRSISS